MKLICILCPMVQNRTFCDKIRINIVLSLTKNSFPTSLTINFATISCQNFVFVIFRCENYCYKKTVFQSNRGRIWSFLSGSGLCCLRIRPLLSPDPAFVVFGSGNKRTGSATPNTFKSAQISDLLCLQRTGSGELF